jgi:hypothetical protein
MRLEDIVGLDYMEARKKATREYMDEILYGKPCSLADCEATAPKKKSFFGSKAPEGVIKKEEIPMSAYSSATVITEAACIEKDQRRALKDALYTAFRSKVADAKKKFGITGDESPESMKEFIARVKAGKFVLREEFEDCYPSTAYFDWRDPSHKKDKDGYKAARAELDTEYADLGLKVAIIPVEKALAAVEAYKAAK